MKSETKYLNEKSLKELIRWNPHPNQLKILESESKDVVICAGRRFGKSALCAYIALRTLLEDKKNICLIAPTYDLTDRVFDYLTGWIRIAFPSIKIQTRPFPVIKTSWGSQLDCKSAENPIGILGKTYDLTIVDECSRIPRRIYEIYIFPTTHKQSARTIFISTPFGKNWFYDKYQMAQTMGGSFHFTSRDGVEVNDEIWAAAKASLPKDIFQQEYEAVFLADAAQVFRNLKNCINEDCLAEPMSGHRYIMGLDVAKFEDFTALCVIDKETHNVVYLDRWNKIPYPLQTQRVVDVARKYGTNIVIDAANVGAAMGDDLRSRGFDVIDFKAVGSMSRDKEIKGNKEQAINKLGSFFEEGNISIPPDPIWIGELDAYGYQMTKEGHFKYCAPEGLHDDCVCAMYLATWTLHGRRQKENIKAIKAINESARPKKFQYL